MTLLELLRQELPKRGGWPEGVNRINQGWDGRLENFKEDGDSCNLEMKTTFPLTTSHRVKSNYVHECGADFVTREQYEATGWDGTGLPPVGVECEYMKYQRGHNDDWFIGTINYISDCTVVISQKGHKGEIVGHPVNFQFRPLRTEAERAIDEMVQLSGVSTGAAKILYDAGYRK